jgi:hypothetical protein
VEVGGVVGLEKNFQLVVMTVEFKLLCLGGGREPRFALLGHVLSSRFVTGLSTACSCTHTHTHSGMTRANVFVKICQCNGPPVYRCLKILFYFILEGMASVCYRFNRFYS